MIIRETRVQECWCPICGSGQMADIHSLCMESKDLSLHKLHGKEIVCKNCGAKNIVEEILVVIPASFLVSAKSDFSKAKSNDDINKWLNNNESQKAS